MQVQLLLGYEPEILQNIYIELNKKVIYKKLILLEIN